MLNASSSRSRRNSKEDCSQREVFSSWLRSPLRFLLHTRSRLPVFTGGAMANSFPTVRHLKITKQSHSEHRQRDFDILPFSSKWRSTCRNTRCRRLRSCWSCFPKGWMLHFCQIHSQRCLLQCSWGYTFPKQHNTVDVPSHDFKPSKWLTAQCYASSKCNWSKYAVKQSDSFENRTGLYGVCYL